MIRKLMIAALPALLVTLPSPVHAQRVNCNDPSSTYEMNVCAEKDFKAADAKLNTTYKKAMRQVEDRDLGKPYDAKSWKGALRQSQRACKNLGAQEWSGGTGTTVAALGCMTQKTMQRTRELNERYEAQ